MSKLAPGFRNCLEDRVEAKTTVIIHTASNAGLERLMVGIDGLSEMSVFGVTREAGHDTLANIHDREQSTILRHQVSD